MPVQSSLHLVDPELRPGLAMFPPMPPEGEALREFCRAGTEQAEWEPPAGLKVAEIVIHNADGDPVPLIVCRPDTANVVPAICAIHGGGFITGSASRMAAQKGHLALELGCAMVFVDYALAPDHPHPRPIEDCYAALAWIHREAAEQGFDPARVIVSGISAGGGLATALALLARDRGEYPVAFQHLLFPMLDDRTVDDPEPHPFGGEFVWTPESNRIGWGALLGREPGGEGVSPYAAPARASDLSGLPPAFLTVGTLDLLLEENMDYALRLTKAGVPVELHVYPGVYHGAHAILTAEVARKAEDDSVRALRLAMAPASGRADRTDR